LDPGGRILSAAGTRQVSTTATARMAKSAANTETSSSARCEKAYLRTEFRSRLSRNREAERGFAPTERDVAEPAPPRSWDRPLGAQDRQRFEV